MDMARFQLKPDDIIIERRPDPAYEKLFPYYVELCAARQFRSKLTGEGGGPAGHAILYIKGACRDDDAHSRNCDAAGGFDPEHGPRRDAFHEFHWLPTRQGALLKTLPVHDPNDLYDTTFRSFTLQSPFLMGKTQWAIDLLSDQRFVDLVVNPHYFGGRYGAILAQRNEQRDSMVSVRGNRFRRVEGLYYDYIRSQNTEVHSMLNRIAEIPEPSRQPVDE